MRQLLLAASFVLSAGAAFAQAYPTKPIRIVVPYAPGASNDTLSRATAESMSPLLGQPIVGAIEFIIDPNLYADKRS